METKEPRLTLFRKESQRNHYAVEGEVWLGTPRLLKILTLLLLPVIAVALGYAVTADYARRESVTGWLVPQGGMVRVVARSAGIIESIEVKQGDQVGENQRLAKLRLGATTVDGNVGDSLTEDTIAELKALQNSYTATSSILNEELKNIDRQRGSIKLELNDLNKARENLQRRKALTMSELTRLQVLQSKGFVTNSAVDVKKGDILNAEQSLMENSVATSSKERQLSDLEYQKLALPSKLAELDAKTLAQKSTLKQKLTQVRAQAEETVVAPISGTIAAVHAEPGQMLNSGNLIAIVNPSGGALEVELFVPSKAIGFIKAGQNVSFRFQAFPYQRYGVGNGIIRTISKTVIAPSDIPLMGVNIKEPVFRVKATLSKDYIEAYGEAIRLQPGMLVDASVLLERRNLLALLLDPVLAVSKRN